MDIFEHSLRYSEIDRELGIKWRYAAKMHFYINLCAHNSKLSAPIVFIYMSTPDSSFMRSQIYEMQMLTHWGRTKITAISQMTSKCIFFNENVWISMFSMKIFLKVPIDNIPALVQIMAWCRSGDKSLSEPMLVSLLTHICVTRSGGEAHNKIRF